jgi:hypothetical protein
MTLNLQNLVLATMIVAFGAAQYMLAYQAIRDLIRRPRVRGGNKMTWAIIILCLPVLGAFFYSWMGPTSFVRRGAVPQAQRAADAVTARAMESGGPRPQNVTPLHPRRAASTGRQAARRAGMTRSRAHNTTTGSNRVRRTGS